MKNFRRRGRGCRRGNGPRSPAMPRDAPRCPFRPRGAPRGRAPAPPHAFPAPARSPPGTSHHETGPSTTFGWHCPNMHSWAKIKPQVDGLRFSLNTGYARGVGVKRSRWAGFVAAAWRTAGPKRHETGKGCLTTDFQPIAQHIGTQLHFPRPLGLTFAPIAQTQT